MSSYNHPLTYDPSGPSSQYSSPPAQQSYQHSGPLQYLDTYAHQTACPNPSGTTLNFLKEPHLSPEYLQLHNRLPTTAPSAGGFRPSKFAGLGSGTALSRIPPQPYHSPSRSHSHVQGPYERAGQDPSEFARLNGPAPVKDYWKKEHVFSRHYTGSFWKPATDETGRVVVRHCFMSKTHPDPKEEILPGVEAEDFDGLRPTSDYQACVSSGLPADLLSRAQGNYVWAIDELMTKDDLQEFAWPNIPGMAPSYEQNMDGITILANVPLGKTTTAGSRYDDATQILTDNTEKLARSGVERLMGKDLTALARGIKKFC